MNHIENEICSANDINVCKIRAELSEATVTVWCHSPITQQWRVSEKTTFENGKLTSDTQNEIHRKAAGFLGYERKTADYVALAGCLHSFFETIQRATWYNCPITIPDGIELFGERGNLMVKTVSELIMKKYKFITFTDTLETMVYLNGVYRPHADRTIAVTVQSLLGDRSKERHQSEVLNFIKYASLMSRKDVYTGTRYINMANGIYDREIDKLIPHNSNIIFTYQLPVEYNQNAKCPNIQKFFSDVLQPEDALCTLEFFGYCLIPDTSIQKAVMLVGGGENGKSKLLGLLGAFVGYENTSRESLQGLEKDPYSGAELYGKLVNIFPDLPSAALFENSMFKTLTGDDGEIRARKIYGEPFKYQNTAKLIFSANQAPPVPRGDYAYYRRWLLFEFVNTFSGDKRDPKILEKITTTEELSGLFNLVIPALKNLMQNGKYTYSRSNEQVERLYKIKSDPVAAFAEECIIYSDSDTPKRDIYQKYAQWCNDKKIKLEAENIFGKRFKKLGQEPGQATINGVRIHVWNSCAIRPITSIQSNIENCMGSKNQPVQENPPRETSCTGCMGCKTHCDECSNTNTIHYSICESSEYMQHIENKPCNPCSGVETEPVNTENELHGFKKSTRAEYQFSTDLSMFCKDWEFVYNQSINRTNCEAVATEYAQKRKIDDIDGILYTICKAKGIETNNGRVC